MIRNLIFDWSGTLVDDLPAVWQASNQIFRLAGTPEISQEQFRAEFALPYDGFYRKYVGHVSEEQLRKWFYLHFRAVQASVTALPHATEFLAFCRERGLRTFLLSAVPRVIFDLQGVRAEFEPNFDAAYLGVADKREKIHELLAEQRLAANETLFVGDMQHDVDAAHEGGIHSCAVLTGYNSLEQLQASQPDLIVEHLGELREILVQNGMQITRPNEPPGARQNPAPMPIATVGGLIFNDRGEVLMIRTHKWSDLWGIPGGKIKFGETSIEALKRELLEETNLQVDGIEFVLVQDCIHSTEFYRDAHFLLLNYTCMCRGETKVILNAEAQEYRWMEPMEALNMPLNQPTRVLVQAVIDKALVPKAPALSE